MGQALYRKYRSKNLAEIIGQGHITDTLSSALKSGNISHAYLLTGPRGVGKTSVARILAYEVNGLPYDEDATHLDIIEIDAASNRRIDEIRELRDKVHIAPANAKYKVYIIDEVHMLTREAFNALLKTLEEPPAHAIFILATTEAYKLPETIVSRTQRFTFRPIDKSKVVAHLKDIAKQEKIDVEDEALSIIAEHGEGSFRDSISLLDQIRSRSQKVTSAEVLEMLGEAPAELIDKLKTAILSQNASDIVQVLHSMFQNGYEPSAVAKQLGQTLRSELLKGSLPLDYQSCLELLSRLLDVSGATDPAISLELALLKTVSPTVTKSRLASSTDSGPIPEKPPVKPNTQKPKEIKKSEAEKKSEKTAGSSTVPQKVKPTGEIAELGMDLDDVWQQVMAAIKKQHNTLYSVMRLAQPEWAEDNLKLMFGFTFHQKRINEARNREIIAHIVSDITGHRFSVSSVLDENLKPTGEPETTEAKTDDPVISNISNIFGGAELVES